ncbi:CGNR zinc finger domain-containing protein [Rhodococcus erythropolis]|uniref:CGNR zinc finger domain-containing protein n=1 Tax=Rhodococcus erythropolis TaxID=1833 RepID=UPI00087859B9|nr:CGNR zinc finger domain-containing protein [Rhodococcus erythropolis]
MTQVAPSTVPGTCEHPSLALVDTVHGRPDSGGHDELSSPETATAWLIDCGLVAPEVGLQEQCRSRLVRFRHDLRDLFVAQISMDVPSPKAIEALNRALTSAPGALLLRFGHEVRFFRSVEHPMTQAVDHAMAIIAEDAAALLTSADASRIAACESDSCQQLFLRTHARRQWCSNRCGDRVRAARAYARRRAARNIDAT